MNGDEDHLVGWIIQAVTDIQLSKGGVPCKLLPESLLLGGDSGIDSLDLALLVRELEAKSGLDPFRNGFIHFRTVRDLARLYVK